tara:strand:+ start:924 stop:1820 length:897 start_codon:yes stop_codon:yes gene_type:complete
MTHLRPSNNTTASTPDHAGVEFGISENGFPVARIGDLLMAMVPARNGSHILVSALGSMRQFVKLTREDFYSHDGLLDSEAAFRARVFETAEHKRELSALGRIQTRMTASTPWGLSQMATIYDEGVVAHTTASHGGFHLSPARNLKVDCSLRNDGGYYEEDNEWAIVALTFPALFTAYERNCADRTIRDSWPEVWERNHDRDLDPGESWSKDKKAFKQRHAGDWVVIAAILSDHHDEMAEVLATLGGKRAHGIEERRYLVPNDDYAKRERSGFVIDQKRHAVYHGPSSFIGWQPGTTSA